MVEGHSELFDIQTMELDFRSRIPLFALCRWAMNIADIHAEILGFDMKTLFSRRQGWILLKYRITVNEYPEGNQKIIVTTWHSGSESRYAFREFQFFRQGEENPFARASSAWMLMDIDKGRPLRVADHLNPSEVDETRLLPLDLDTAAPDAEPVCEKVFTVRLSDIDPLNHVNSMRYIEWIVESALGDEWETAEITDLFIEFRKQALYGDSIISRVYSAHEESDSEIFAHVLLKTGSNSDFARARTVRRKISIDR